MPIRPRALACTSLALLGLVLLSGCCGRCTPPRRAAQADGSFRSLGQAEGQPAAPGLPPVPAPTLPPFGPPQILLEERCLLVADPAVLEGVKRSPDGLRSVPLTHTQATALLRRLRSSGRVEVLQAPRLLVLDGQEATIEIGEVLEQGAGRPGGETPNPSPFVGHRLEVTPTRHPDSGDVRITLYSYWRGRPGKRGALPPPHELRATATLPDDHAILLLAPAPPSGPRYAVLLHAKSLLPDPPGR